MLLVLLPHLALPLQLLLSLLLLLLQPLPMLILRLRSRQVVWLPGARRRGHLRLALPIVPVSQLSHLKARGIRMMLPHMALPLPLLLSLLLLLLPQPLLMLMLHLRCRHLVLLLKARRRRHRLTLVRHLMLGNCECLGFRACRCN